MTSRLEEAKAKLASRREAAQENFNSFRSTPALESLTPKISIGGVSYSGDKFQGVQAGGFVERLAVKGWTF